MPYVGWIHITYFWVNVPSKAIKLTKDDPDENKNELMSSSGYSMRQSLDPLCLF